MNDPRRPQHEPAATFELLHCPLRLAHIARDDEGRITHWYNEPCNADLYVEFTASYGLTYHDHVSASTLTAEDAHATSWKIVCANGHEIVVDPETYLYANDTAAPCQIGDILRALPYWRTL